MGDVRPALRSQYASIALTRARLMSPLVAIAIAVSLALSETTHIPLSRGVIEINIVVITILTGLSVSMWVRIVPDAYGHLMAVLVWWAPITTSLASYTSSRDPKLFILLMLEMFAGIINVSPRWLVGSFILFDAIWTPLACAIGGPDLGFEIPTLYAAQMFAILIHALKHHSLQQAENNRLEAEHQLGETRRSEQARAELTEQLVHAQRLEAVGTLAAGLAHDMNNVLAAIMGFAEAVIETSSDDQSQEDCREILREAGRGAELTRGLLTFSRRGQYRKEVLRVGEIVDEVVALLGRTLPKPVEIEKHVLDVGACIEGDPAQFSQMLVNLGINASDAMAGKGRLSIRSETIELATERHSLPPGRYAKLMITDTGSGMDEATRTRVFEPFFTTKPMGKGTGLGLALVWGVAAKSLGTVTIESELGKGSTFSIFLPLTDKPPPRSVEVSGVTRLPQRGTVLVVDDEPAVRRSTTRMLERLGLETIDADCGAEALRQFEAHASEIAFVVLDMGMPDMSGAEVFRALRARSNVKVLIATGYAIEDQVQELVAAGARILEKPFKLEALEAEVKHALHRR